MGNPNENCLAGMRCPQCGDYGPFTIEATASFVMYDDGAGDHGDLEWDEKSACQCYECSFAGTVADFTEPD